MEISFTAELNLEIHGQSTYLMVRVPQEESDELEDLNLQRGGFDSIKVDASIGSSTWRTSVFPSKEGYLLLVAKKLAKAESLLDGQLVTVTLRPVL